jgi:hypothetical protein
MVRACPPHCINGALLHLDSAAEKELHRPVSSVAVALLSVPVVQLRWPQLSQAQVLLLQAAGVLA